MFVEFFAYSGRELMRVPREGRESLFSRSEATERPFGSFWGRGFSSLCSGSS